MILFVGKTDLPTMFVVTYHSNYWDVTMVSMDHKEKEFTKHTTGNKVKCNHLSMDHMEKEFTKHTLGNKVRCNHFNDLSIF